MKSQADSSIRARLKRLPHFSAVGAIVTFVATGTNIVLLKYVHTPLVLTWVCVYAAAINLAYYGRTLRWRLRGRDPAARTEPSDAPGVPLQLPESRSL